MKEKIKEAFDQFSLEVSKVEIEILDQYLQTFLKWNKTINLSAHREAIEAIEKNILDCAYFSKYIIDKEIFDFGSGAGLPGLILAILNPERNLYLIESDQKKVSFLQNCSFKLGIKNVNIIREYVDVSKGLILHQAPKKIEIIVSRATISPDKLISLGDVMLSSGGRIGMMLSDKQMESFLTLNFETFKVENEIKYILPWSKIKRSFLFLKKNEK